MDEEVVPRLVRDERRKHLALIEVHIDLALLCCQEEERYWRGNARRKVHPTNCKARRADGGNEEWLQGKLGGRPCGPWQVFEHILRSTRRQ